MDRREDHGTTDFLGFIARNQSFPPQKGESQKGKEPDPGSGTTLIVNAPRPRDEHSY